MNLGHGAFLLWMTLLFVSASSEAQSRRTADGNEDHKASVHGIEMGMTAQQVVDLVGRMPDARKDEKEEVIVYWKVEEDNVLQVNFRKDRVSRLALQYKKPRPTTDLWLVPLSSPASGSGLTAADPRVRRDYKITETNDKMRTVWERQEKTHAGYRVQIQFLSASRKQAGDRFGEFVEFKYVSVVKDDLKKFEQSVAEPKQ
jgi:hypothetical protein